MPYVITEECENCGACVAGCESEAIIEGESQSHIDITRCIECGTCELNCPFGAIVFVDDAEYQQKKPSQETPPPEAEEDQPR
jgi:ferredoxin